MASKVLRMGTLPALIALAAGLLTQAGQDFPAFSKYAAIIVGALGMFATFLHPGLGGDNPWFSSDHTPDDKE